MTMVETYTSQGASGVWWEHRWRLACVALVWETPKIRMTSRDNGAMDGHLILGWILRISDGWGTHLCQWLSLHMQTIPNLTKMKHQMRSSWMNLKDMKAPCLGLLLIKRQCYFALFLAKFVIWSSGLQSFSWIIWIFSACKRKWPTRSVQKWSSNSETHQIPLYS